jgi:hypothetical protein
MAVRYLLQKTKLIVFVAAVLLSTAKHFTGQILFLQNVKKLSLGVLLKH